MILSLLMTLAWSASAQSSQATPAVQTLPVQYAGYYRRADDPHCTIGNVIRLEPDRTTWYRNEVNRFVRVVALGNQSFRVTSELDVGLWGVATFHFFPDGMSRQSEFDAQPVAFRKCPGGPQAAVSDDF